MFGALDGDTGAALANELAAATGYRVLGWWDNGIRHISNAVRPIRTPADCAGLRLRTLDNAQHQVAFRRLGFVPTFIDVADLPRAVADGTVDAQENPLTNIVNFNLHLHHKHLSLTGHLLGIAPLLVNRARFDALPSALRSVLIAAARDSEASTARAGGSRGCGVSGDFWSKAGVAVVSADAIDLPAFRAAVAV